MAERVIQSARNAEGPGLIPGSGRSPREGNGHPLQYCCLEIPWTEEPGTVHSDAESDMTKRLHFQLKT